MNACLLFLREGQRLADASRDTIGSVGRNLLLEAIISLQNARSARDCTPSLDAEIGEIIRDMRRSMYK